MNHLIWLVPIQPSPVELKTISGVLRRHHIPHELVGADQVPGRLIHQHPWGALLQGGKVTSDMVDVQRRLADAEVPTMVVAREVSDNLESILLDRGAHDVVALPATARKLGSRIDAMVRAIGAPSEPRLPESVSVAGWLEVAPRRRSVRVGPTELELTRTEFDLLLALALRQGEVVPRKELVSASGSSTFSTRALESHLSRVRVKLRDAGASDVLVSVRGVGYRLGVIERAPLADRSTGDVPRDMLKTSEMFGHHLPRPGD